MPVAAALKAEFLSLKKPGLPEGEPEPQISISTFFDGPDPIEFLKLDWGPDFAALGFAHEGVGGYDALRVLYSINDAEEHLASAWSGSETTSPRALLCSCAIGKVASLKYTVSQRQPKLIVMNLASNGSGPEAIKKVQDELAEALPDYQTLALKSYSYSDFGLPMVGGNWLALLQQKPAAPTQDAGMADKVFQDFQAFFVKEPVALEDVVLKRKDTRVRGEVQIWQKRATQKSKSKPAMEDPDHVQEEPVEQEGARGKKRSLEELLVDAAQFRWLPSSAPLLEEGQAEELEHLPADNDLLKVHCQVLLHHAKSFTGRARSMLCCDATFSRFSRHKVYIGEIPPLKPRTEILTLNAAGKLRLLTTREILAAKGYAGHKVKLHLLPRATALAHANAAMPVPLAIVSLAWTRMYFQE